jgi:hypothetical protein
MRTAIGLHRGEHWNSGLVTDIMISGTVEAYRLAFGRSNMTGKRAVQLDSITRCQSAEDTWTKKLQP